MKKSKRVLAFAFGFVIASVSVVAVAAKPNPYLCNGGTIGSWLCENYGGVYCDLFCI